jgi:hypothetical protein
MKNNKSKPTKYIVYFLILLALAIGLTVAAIQFSRVTPVVNIEYNVGEIIGAILAGLGIAAAGTAYASKTLNELDKE